MSIFADPVRHAANPPETWEVHKAGERNWQLRTRDGTVLEYARRTRHETEGMRTAGFTFRLWQDEARWYAGQPVTNWKVYVPPTVEAAHAGGQLARRLDLPRVPPRQWFADGPVGTTDQSLIKAWLAGWDTANLCGEER